MPQRGLDFNRCIKIKKNSKLPYCMRSFRGVLILDLGVLILDGYTKSPSLRPLAADPAGQLDVLRVDGHSLGVDGTKIGVLEKTGEIGLRRILQGLNGMTLEAQVGLEVLGYFPDQPLEGQLAKEQFSRLLVLANLAQRNSARTKTMGLLDTAVAGCRLAGSLGGERLARSFSAGGLARSLLGPCGASPHCDRRFEQTVFLIPIKRNSPMGPKTMIC